MSLRGVLAEHRWILLEEPWLDDELILAAVAMGLAMTAVLR